MLIVDGDPTRAYNVGPDALLLNFKAFRFAFVPDPSRKTIAVFGEPPSSSLELASNVRYGEGPCGDWRAGIKAQPGIDL